MALFLEILPLICIGAGCLFFIAGTVGLLRFPDLFTCLHALSKADNVGLGLVVLGLALGADGLSYAAKLILIYMLSMLSSSTTSHLIARKALRTGARPWN